MDSFDKLRLLSDVGGFDLHFREGKEFLPQVLELRADEVHRVVHKQKTVVKHLG